MIKKEVNIKLSKVQGQSDSIIAQNEFNDCVVLALAAMSGASYDEAHQYAREVLGRRDRRGVSLGVIKSQINKIGGLMGKALVRVNIKTQYKNRGELVERQMTTGTLFKRISNDETYLVVTRGHIFCIKNGEVVGGNHTDVTAMKTRIKEAWAVVDPREKKILTSFGSSK